MYASVAAFKIRIYIYISTLFMSCLKYNTRLLSASTTGTQVNSNRIQIILPTSFDGDCAVLGVQN